MLPVWRSSSYTERGVTSEEYSYRSVVDSYSGLAPPQTVDGDSGLSMGVDTPVVASITRIRVSPPSRS